MIKYIHSFWRSVNSWRLACGVLVTLLIAVLGYEARIVDRVYNKIQSNGTGLHSFMSGEFSQEGFKMIASRTQQDLFAFKPILHSQSDICRTEMLLRQSIFPHNSSFHFSHALLLIGLLESHSDEDADVALQSIEDWCDKIIDTEGQLRMAIRYIDDCMIGYAFCDLYDRTHNDKYKRAADQLANYLLQEYPRNDRGTLPYFRQHTEVMLIDDKIVSAFLVRYGEQFGVPQATDLGANQLLEFLRLGVDPNSGLPWHAYTLSGSRTMGQARTMGQLGWLRGIGWLSIGLSGTLEYLPKDHAHYQELRDGFLVILSTVRAYQENEKCWNWAIKNTLSHEDTSGTAMIGYAIENAIASGVIGKSWASVSENALAAVLRSTRTNGVVDSTLADCNGVGHYAKHFGPSNFAQGPTTALYSLILNRIGSEKESISVYGP